MQKRFWSILYCLLLLILLAIIAVLSFCIYQHKKEQQKFYEIPKSTEIAVAASPIVEQKVQLPKKYIGYVVPINQVDITPYINGFVDEIFVKSGQFVKTGQPLVQIQPDEYIARFEAAKASVAQTSASLNNAKVYYERIKKAGAKAISQSEIDNAQAAFLEALAAYEQAKADVMLAKVNLSYTSIAASIDGLVGYVDLSVGDYIAPAKSLFSIIQTDPIRVVFSIPDKDYLEEKTSGQMFANDVIKLVLSDGKIYDYAGKFAFFDNNINRGTGSVAAYADFRNPNNLLLAGAYVEVDVIKTAQNAVIIKKELMQMKDDENFVYIIRAGRLDTQKVQFLGSTSENYIIKGDFLPTDMILSELPSNIEVGTKVVPSAPQKQPSEER